MGVVIKAKKVADLVGERVQKRCVSGILGRSKENRVELAVVRPTMDIHLEAETDSRSHLQSNGEGKYYAVRLGKYTGKLCLEGVNQASQEFLIENVERVARRAIQGNFFCGRAA